MPIQFIRLNCYGAVASHRRKNHENAFDILDEAGREPGAAPHVRKPQPPTLLFGEPPQAVRLAVSDLTRVARDHRGAPLRRGAAVLYAIVASYPIRWRQFDGSAGHEEYSSWRTATLSWLVKQFGVALRSVVEHTDETQPHLHAFVIPPLLAGHRINHHFHPGRSARAAALAKGDDHIVGERAYRDGMRAWQQSFYQEVSSFFDHDRVGPRRKRFRRDAALARQASDQLLERLEVITAEVLKTFITMPGEVMGAQKAELEALKNMFVEARREHHEGQTDVIERLEEALAKPIIPSYSREGIECQGNLNPDELGMERRGSTLWQHNIDGPDPDCETDQDAGYDDDSAPDAAFDDDHDEGDAADQSFVVEHLEDWSESGRDMDEEF
jgi:hypothetical protein